MQFNGEVKLTTVTDKIADWLTVRRAVVILLGAFGFVYMAGFGTREWLDSNIADPLELRDMKAMIASNASAIDTLTSRVDSHMNRFAHEGVTDRVVELEQNQAELIIRLDRIQGRQDVMICMLSGEPAERCL